ncbi:MAG: hypothetical protein QOF35_792 [Actinomycetota bacterium]|jgi:hypothetical protein|nr:hypothetical protein [Actinomycetota bacterium]
MARKVHLHIGTMRSGTTYIQELCERNREQLLEKGVLWPTADCYQAVKDLFGWPQDGNTEPNQWPVLDEEIRGHRKKVIVSNELLAAASYLRIGRLLKALFPAEVRVVITARDLARAVPSQWVTSVKNGSTLGWPEFSSSVCSEAPIQELEAQLKPPMTSHLEKSSGRFEPGPMRERFWLNHDVAEIIRRWRTFVPAERVALVTVPPPGGDPEVLAERFGSAVGVQLTGLEQPDSESTTSLGSHSAELMRRLNELMSTDELIRRRHGLKVALGREVLGARAMAEPRFALTQDQHDWLASRADAMIGEIESTGVRVLGSLDDLVPARHPAPDAVSPADTSEADLREAAFAGLIGMAKVVEDMRTNVIHAAAELEESRAEAKENRRRMKKQQRRTRTAR